MAKSLNKTEIKATENNFKIGESAPIEFFIMWNAFDKFTELPVFMDGDDWNTYGERCNEIPDLETAQRLFEQWKEFQKATSENER